MSTLFPLEPVYPEGFAYHEGFLSEQEEQDLLAAIADVALHPFLFQGYIAKRRVASFGLDWNFNSRQLSLGKPIPELFSPLIAKVAGTLDIEPSAFAELLVTEYEPGAVINWHRDAPPFALIAGVSLAADVSFRLRPYAKELQGRRATRSFTVARRSLYVMQGSARSDWEHSTAPATHKRFSVTLRTIYGS